MDLLTTHGTKLAPKDTAEGVAVFRAQVIGPLLTRAFTSHGELADAIRVLARHKHLPPGASVTRFYSEATLERWYCRFKRHGLSGLMPKRRSDTGHARELTDAQRELPRWPPLRRRTTRHAVMAVALLPDPEAAPRWPSRSLRRAPSITLLGNSDARKRAVLETIVGCERLWHVIPFLTAIGAFGLPNASSDYARTELSLISDNYSIAVAGALDDAGPPRNGRDVLPRALPLTSSSKVFAPALQPDHHRALAA